MPAAGHESDAGQPAAPAAPSLLLREARLLVPAAVLVLVVLSAFTLLSYRSTLDRLAAERRAEALRLADALAGEVASGGQAGAARSLPAGATMATADRQGTVLLRRGVPLSEPFFAPAGGAAPAGELVRGPDATGVLTVITQVTQAPEARFLRLDLPSPALAGQLRAAAILTWLVIIVDGAVLVWLVLYLRRVLGPYEELLARAVRQLGPDVEPPRRLEEERGLILDIFEQALARREEAGLRALEQALAAPRHTGMLLLDAERRVLALNPAGAALLGRAAPPPRSPLEAFLADEPALLQPLATAVASGDEASRLTVELGPAGHRRTLQLTVTALFRPDRSPLGHLVLFSDETEASREAAASQLAQSLAHLGELSAGVAHELRNGLATLEGYVTLLRREPPPEKREAYLAEIERETTALGRVVHDFLAFARPSAPLREPVDLRDLVLRVLKAPELAGIRLADELGERPPLLAGGDPALLRRALANLFLNAVQAMERVERDAGDVTVRLGHHERGLLVEVLDRGSGLPAEVRDRLFHPFASGRRDGVGLGLSLAHRFLTLHGAELVVSDREGGGTRAAVRFPQALLRERPSDPRAG